MKKWLVVLLFVFSFSYGQNDTIKSIGVVAADKMNIVYRGVANPIAITVSNCKSFTAAAPGLTKVSDGHYSLTPGAGQDVKVILAIVQFDDTVITEKHTFRIKNIPNPIAEINGRNCQNCIVQLQRSEFKNAVVSLNMGVAFDLDFNVRSFSIKIANKEEIFVSGNRFDSVYKTISKLKSGTKLTISDVKVNFDGYLRKTIPIIIEIIDDEIPFFQSKEFIKDSLQNIRNQKKLELKGKSKK